MDKRNVKIKIQNLSAVLPNIISDMEGYKENKKIISEFKNKEAFLQQRRFNSFEDAIERAQELDLENLLSVALSFQKFLGLYDDILAKRNRNYNKEEIIRSLDEMKINISNEEKIEDIMGRFNRIMIVDFTLSNV